jgi:hypothetical protein
MSHKVFELEVKLRGIEPPVWRRLEVPGASSLEDVHFAVQVAMGWTNSHLHQFDIDGTHYGMVDIDEAPELEDERAYSLEDVVPSGSSLVYEYDFGDGWEHDLKVVKVSTVTKPSHPRCVGGARACPPEDCGGPGGYANLLESLANPKHKEHETLVEWSDGFEPERFALPKKGQDLRSEIARLKALAGGDDSSEPDPAGGSLVHLPKALVQSVLALAPMARASLAALIAGSLADEVELARSTVDRLASVARRQPPSRHGDRTARVRR